MSEPTTTCPTPVMELVGAIESCRTEASELRKAVLDKIEGLIGKSTVEDLSKEVTETQGLIPRAIDEVAYIKVCMNDIRRELERL